MEKNNHGLARNPGRRLLQNATEVGMKRRGLAYIPGCTWIGKWDLLDSTENSAQYSVIISVWKESEREWGYRLKVSGWRSSLVARGLRVWHHHCYGLGRCCGSGCCCGMGLITDLGTSAYCRCTHAPKKRKKKKEMGRSSRQKISKDLIKLNSTKLR